MTPVEVVAFYVKQLIIQYRNLPRATATIDALVSEIVAGLIHNDVQNGFNLDTAAGAQLDVVAAYRGASRLNFGITIGRELFEMGSYVDSNGTVQALKGFVLYTDLDANITWYFRRYAETDATAGYALTDDELRQLTRFKIKVHSSVLSLKNIDLILFEFFQSRIYLQETGVMQMTYFYQATDPDTLNYIVRSTNNLPKPAGVSVFTTSF